MPPQGMNFNKGGGINSEPQGDRPNVSPVPLDPAAPPQGMSAEQQLGQLLNVYGDFNARRVINEVKNMVAAARADERAQACQYLCHRCEEGWALEYDCMSKVWRHSCDGIFFSCHAHELRCIFEANKLPEAQPVELRKEVPMGLTIDACEGNSVPLCPYCGHQHQYWWDYGIEKDKENKLYCDNEDCEKQFSVILNVVPKFNTYPIEPSEGEGT